MCFLLPCRTWHFFPLVRSSFLLKSELSNVRAVCFNISFSSADSSLSFYMDLAMSFSTLLKLDWENHTVLHFSFLLVCLSPASISFFYLPSCLQVADFLSLFRKTITAFSLRVAQESKVISICPALRMSSPLAWIIPALPLRSITMSNRCFPCRCFPWNQWKGSGCGSSASDRTLRRSPSAHTYFYDCNSVCYLCSEVQFFWSLPRTPRCCSR